MYKLTLPNGETIVATSQITLIELMIKHPLLADVMEYVIKDKRG